MVKASSLFIGLSLLFVGLAVALIGVQLPEWHDFWALFRETDRLELLLIQSYTLPRITMACLAGGILGLASLLLQQVMNNPLASDNTLGISAGSQFALFLTAIFAPDWLELGASAIALIGAGVSLLLVLGLAMRKTLSPLLLILSGLVVNLYFGAFSALMMLFYPEEARGLIPWGAGSLVQESWRDSQWLALQAVPCLLIIAMLLRPLNLLSLNDSNAQSLGVPVVRLRLIGVVVSAYLISAVVSAVGMLGFIGLAAATLVRQLGIHSFKQQVLGAWLMGALLLAITDLLLQFLHHFSAMMLPTGAVTALLGTPLLLWLMFRAVPTGRVSEPRTTVYRAFKRRTGVGLCVLLLLGIGLALSVGRHASGEFGLDFCNGDMSASLWALRYPRMLVAMSVGVLLGITGVILQRLTLNPMASPELLGVSSGASMGVLAVLLLFATPHQSLFWIFGIVGALLALLVLTAINHRSGMLPEKVLLTGISLSALFETFQRLLLASGDPRAFQLLSWTSGSTQQATAEFAVPFFLFSLGLVAFSLLFSRWLELLGLQAPMAQALGIAVSHTRWILIGLSALFTTLATLLIGPLSFIGLFVPHLSRALGANHARLQLLVSALLGGLIMLFADAIGRQILFPYEVPAGLVATLIGGSYFLVMLRKI